MNTAKPAEAPRPVPGKRPDDDSIAGEEDPGASIDVVSPQPQPQPEPPPPGPAPGANKPAAR